MQLKCALKEIDYQSPFRQAEETDSLLGDIDSCLVERALAGDTRAFEEVYLSLRDSIYSFAYHMLGTRMVADDITQEVFIFLIEHPEKYSRERGALKPFLYGIARNKVMHHLRRNGLKRDRTSEMHSAWDSFQGRNPLEILLDQEFLSEVEKQLAMLPSLQREVIILRELQELSYEEIAAIVGDNINTVKSRVHRARLTLAEGLAPYLGTERVVRK